MTARATLLIQKIHIAKGQLGLDDDTYRGFLRDVTGKTSSKLCTASELEGVLKAFEKAGFKPKGKVFKGPSTKLAAKIHALWLSGWNLGVIRDPSDAAMEAFIHRQTSIAKAQWLKDSRDAAKVIDALKAWLAREGGVQWTTTDARGKSVKKDPQEAVIDAQCLCLMAIGTPEYFPDDMSHIEIQKYFGKIIRKAQAEGQF